MPTSTKKSEPTPVEPIEPVENEATEVTEVTESVEPTIRVVTVTLDPAEDHPAISLEVQTIAGAYDDFELLDDIARAMQGDGTRYPAIMRRITEPAETQRILNALRDENGRISTGIGIEFVTALLKAANPNS